MPHRPRAKFSPDCHSEEHRELPFLSLALPSLNPIYLIFHSFNPPNTGDRHSSHQAIPEQDGAGTGHLLWHAHPNIHVQGFKILSMEQCSCPGQQQAMHSWRYLQPLCPGVGQPGRMLAVSSTNNLLMGERSRATHRTPAGREVNGRNSGGLLPV